MPLHDPISRHCINIDFILVKKTKKLSKKQNKTLHQAVRSKQKARKSMKRNSILKVLNPILGVLLANQILTGIFHDALPHEAFEIMHEGGGYVFAGVAILHVILNWNWVKANFFKRIPADKA